MSGQTFEWRVSWNWAGGGFVRRYDSEQGARDFMIANKGTQLEHQHIERRAVGPWQRVEGET